MHAKYTATPHRQKLPQWNKRTWASKRPEPCEDTLLDLVTGPKTFERSLEHQWSAGRDLCWTSYFIRRKWEVDFAVRHQALSCAIGKIWKVLEASPRTSVKAICHSIRGTGYGLNVSTFGSPVILKPLALIEHMLLDQAAAEEWKP